MQINLADCKGGVHCVLQYQNFKLTQNFDRIKKL